jgi:hypothetical protein
LHALARLEWSSPILAACATKAAYARSRHAHLSQIFESEFGVIRRDVFHDVAELEAAIAEWIAHRNQQQKPFTWTAKAKPLLASRCRAKKAAAIVKAGRK